MLPITLQGETLHLLAERAIFWPRTQSLLLSDVHWGKAATLRADAVAVPGGTTSRDLARLDQILAQTGATRLVVLGDLFHSRTGKVASRTITMIQEWRAQHATLEMLLIRGNHDRRAGDPPPDLNIPSVNPPYELAPFVLYHEPPVTPPTQGYALAGHIHPGVRLTGAGRQRERLPCFLLGPRLGLLPAFGSFTGTVEVRPKPNDRVYVIADDAVVDCSPARARSH